MTPFYVSPGLFQFAGGLKWAEMRMTRLIYDAVSGGLHWSRRQSVHIAGALFIANNVVIKFDYTHKLDSSPYFLTWAQT